MDTAIQLRRLTENDWEVFRAIRLEALQTNPSVFGSRYDNEISKPDSFWIERITTQGNAIFGLYDGNIIIGVTGVMRYLPSPDDTALFGMTFLRPAYRGRGLSTLFYEARINWVKEQGNIRRIIACIRDGNYASRAANQKYGFIYTGQDEINWIDGKGYEMHYELRLDTP